MDTGRPACSVEPEASRVLGAVCPLSKNQLKKRGEARC